jgi:uncharacterized membrane protein YphA (DoxX/SURF4 family)
MPHSSGSTRHRQIQARRIIGIGLLIALLPIRASAHERWFTPKGPYWDPDWSRLFSLPVLFALASAAIAVTGLALLQRIVGDPLWPRPPIFQGLEIAAPAILGVQAAITLIYMATQLSLFVPNIDLPRNLLGVLIAGVAIAAGFTFITGVLTRIGAAITFGLFVLAFVFSTWYEAMEQVIFVGIATYLAAVGRGVYRYAGQRGDDRSAISDRLQTVALPILRVAAALSIIIVGFTEKLLAPGLGVAFLQEFPHFNVARELGFTWFTDERFVYAAGIAEVTIGAALLSGFLVRVVILAMWIPFNLGIPFLPPTELLGHLPILATLYVLLVRGTKGIPPRDVQGQPHAHTSSGPVGEPNVERDVMPVG